MREEENVFLLPSSTQQPNTQTPYKNETIINNFKTTPFYLSQKILYCMEGSQPPTIPSRQIAVLIDGIHTDIIITVFEGNILLIITQREKIGHWFEAYCDGGDGEGITYTVNILLGSRDDTVPQVYARQIVAMLTSPGGVVGLVGVVGGGVRKLIIGLGFREKCPPPSTLTGLLSVLKVNKIWK